jgi:alpha-tubulin suppressor-like RCC1 family protein
LEESVVSDYSEIEKAKEEDKMDYNDEPDKMEVDEQPAAEKNGGHKADSEVSTSYKKLKIDVDESEVVQPLLTRNSSKSLMSMTDTQHEHLSGSLFASPRTSLLQSESTDMETMPLNENGLLYSWGWGKQSLHDDDEDRLPARSTAEKSTYMADEVQVTSRLANKTILAVSTGQHHSACATSQGTLYMVGTNLHGCVDPDLPEEKVCSKPILLESLGQIRVVQVSCGFDHTAALSSNGSVLTWGSNSHGQLGHRTNIMTKHNSGDGPTHIRPAGMVLGKGRRVSAIACGTYFTMVLTTRRSLLACGIETIAGHRDSSEFGTLKEIPSLVGLPLVGMSAGDGHAAVVTAHGSALVWGKNRNGCCAREYPSELAVPMPVKVSSSLAEARSQSPLTNWEFRKESDGSNLIVKVADDVAIQHVACGYAHTILVTRSGRLLVFGDNCRGQLGMTASEKPVVNAVAVVHPRRERFVSAEAGNAHSLLLDSAGDVWLTTPTGLQCVLQGRYVLAIAAGGDDNAVAIASPPSVVTTQEHQISTNSSEDWTLVDGGMIVDKVETLLDEMNSDSDNKVLAGQDIAKRTEELLR